VAAAVALLLAACGGGGSGGGGSSSVVPNAVTQPYLMALDACDASSCGPSKTIYFLQSSDGVHWQAVPGFTPFTGGVPTIVRRGNTIYLAEQDGHDLAGKGSINAMKLIRYHADTGIWDPPVLIDLTDAQNPGPYVDTDLTRDSQRNLVLVYDTSANGCAAASCDQHIRMAFEVPGSDGGSFVAQANDAVTIQVADQGGAVDPYAFFDGSQYILYVPTLNGPLPQVSQGAQIAKLQTQPVDEETLARARVKMRSALYDSLELFNGFGRADLLSSFALFYDDPAKINRIEAEFAKVTPELIQRTAQEYLRPTNRTILTIVPRSAS